MFRRFGKNSLEKELSSPLYSEEQPVAAYRPQGAKDFSIPNAPQRLFETPPPKIFEEKKEERPSKEEIETTLGEGVTFRGELTFERLLRIDGTFEGELISQGKIIVGPKGRVKANISLREAIIEGRVEGNITVEERLELRAEAIVMGNVRAKILTVDEGVTLVGHVEVCASRS